jgi:hypothetical protein
MRLRYALLAAALAAGCADQGGQTLTGRINRDDFPAQALGVRAVEDGSIVAQAGLDADGRFELTVPRGRYRLEVVTRAGIHQFIVPNGDATKVLAFDSCGNDFDFGDVDFWEEGDPIPECGDGNGGDDGDGTDPGECEDPMDPNCWGGCDPATGVDCGDPPPCPDDDPYCNGGGTDPGCMDPSDPNCGGGSGGCDPATDENCCDPATGVNCCDPENGMDCPPPPCEDPMSPDCDPCLADPSLCEDPCAQDPSLCDPCMGDPECDPCLANPEWCWPGGCEPDGTDPSDGEENGMDSSGCWPDDPTCSDDDPDCWPDPVEPPGCENSGMDPDQPCWEEPPQGAIPEDAPPDGMCD